MDILLLILLFVVKHFIIDFVWQTQDEIEHKGTYLDWRGVRHSFKHGIGTLLILVSIGAPIETGYLYGALDFLIHYHIDWVKMNAARNLTPADRAFWIWLGFDQALHYLTYIVFIAIMIS
jgi:hypothetical protein